MTISIATIRFHNFKAFNEYTLHLDDVNILVGPNNSGKSTIIGAVRALESGIRIARVRTPTRVFVGETALIGHRVPEASLPISLENVHTNFNADDSKISFRLSNGNVLDLIFPSDGGCVLVPIAHDSVVMTPGTFKRQFPISLTIVPVLGPVEHRERRRDEDTVTRGLSTHRASRHFRSYWHYFGENFDAFASLVSSTWKDMEIERPEYSVASGELTMFCIEERRTRELYWVGFGFQVWCQLLTHLSRAAGSSLIVIDEPEVYLHPDVQRQLLGIVRDVGAPILMATHSSEIMSEADPSELVLVDKRRRSGERLKDIAGIQRALTIVGSAQNITLTALARSRRVLFVEGDQNFRLLRRFARRLGMRELGAGLEITPLESGGFGSWERITTLASGIADALGAPLTIAAIYDRDYFCQEHINHVLGVLSAKLSLAHVHRSKEIENYLLCPAALDRAIEHATADRQHTKAPLIALDLLCEITDFLKDDVQAQILAKRAEYLRSSGRDLADVNRETLRQFALMWDDLPQRLSLVPGKEVLSSFRARVQQLTGVTLSDSKIVNAMRQDDFPEELVGLLISLDAFRTATVAQH